MFTDFSTKRREVGLLRWAGPGRAAPGRAGPGRAKFTTLLSRAAAPRVSQPGDELLLALYVSKDTPLRSLIVRWLQRSNMSERQR